MICYRGLMSTPLGQLLVEANDEGLTKVGFDPAQGQADTVNNHPIVHEALNQLTAFFNGKLRQFELPLAAKGTAFRQQVWQQLLTVPYGKTASYSDIANALDNPKAVRAVGAANGANPIAIIVPCHRVIGKNGTLTGYAGGLNRKQWLLAFESGITRV